MSLCNVSTLPKRISLQQWQIRKNRIRAIVYKFVIGDPPSSRTTLKTYLTKEQMTYEQKYIGNLLGFYSMNFIRYAFSTQCAACESHIQNMRILLSRRHVSLVFTHPCFKGDAIVRPLASIYQDNSRIWHGHYVKASLVINSALNIEYMHNVLPFLFQNSWTSPPFDYY